MTSVARKPGRPANPRHLAQRREAILTAATRIFAENGYRQTDVKQIADALGLGKGTIYRYFHSKKALFLAAVDRGMARLVAHITEQADRFSHPLERLGAAVLGYLVYFDEQPELVELIILERAEFRDRERPSFYVHCDEKIGHWHDAFRRMLDLGIARDIPVEAMFDCISNLLYGTMFTNFFKGREKTCEAQAREILEVFCHGILKERGATLAMNHSGDQCPAHGDLL